MTHGTTQGGLASLKFFNMAVDRVVCHWLSMSVEDYAVIHDGLGDAVDESLGVFYTDDGILGSWNPDRIQGALNVTIGRSIRLA